MLAAFTIFIMLAVGYAYFREGLFTAATMCCNVFFAGLIAFNFWEPLANLLEPGLQKTFLEGYEDAFVLIGLFCLSLGLLRLVTNTLANAVIDYDAVPQQGGGVLFGLATGYLVSGFLVCVLQTLPWHENFMAFEWKAANRDSAFNRLFPPDRVWLAMMRRAGAYPLANRADPDFGTPGEDSYYYDSHLTFDKYGTFEIRYARFRRYGDKRDKLPNNGEFARETQQKRRN
jgi:Colicin V production protein